MSDNIEYITDRFGDYLEPLNVTWDEEAGKYVVEIAVHADGDYCPLWLTPKQAHLLGVYLIEAAAVAKAENNARKFDEEFI